MSMIKVWIKLTSYKPKTIEMKLNADIDDTKSEVKFLTNGDKREDYARFNNQKPSSKVPVSQNTTAKRPNLGIEIDNDEDHVPKIAPTTVSNNMPPPVQNKVKQCGGNACPRCRKCIDWSYKGDMDEDYKRYQRDNTYNKILNKDRWRRSQNPTCCYYSYHSHFYGYHNAYHSHYYGGYHVCACKKLNEEK